MSQVRLVREAQVPVICKLVDIGICCAFESLGEYYIRKEEVVIDREGVNKKEVICIHLGSWKTVMFPSNTMVKFVAASINITEMCETMKL